MCDSDRLKSGGGPWLGEDDSLMSDHGSLTSDDAHFMMDRALKRLISSGASSDTSCGSLSGRTRMSADSVRVAARRTLWERSERRLRSS